MSFATSYWPDDPSGEVLLELEAGGFDFSARHQIDFSIDFDNWPPPQEFVAQLQKTYPHLELREPQDDAAGSIVIVIEDRLSYELVTSTQDRLNALAAPHGGLCEAWGVLHETDAPA